ncbi:valine--tRNA ligase [Candidatus Parvarchaeota archaeon]|nr:valine--tRNA ligase [Candidatus Acidifodinimicrobium mancum]
MDELKNWGNDQELSVLDGWKKEGPIKFSIDSKKPYFGIDTPPPYTSGRPWHVGAAAHYSKIDMIGRAARMLGYNVLFPVGMDRNGIPVERYVEKKYNIRMRDTEREEFLSLCHTALDELEKEMIEILERLGYSADFESIYRTDSDEYRVLTQATFIDLWRKGLVYRGTRPSNYCYDCNTTIADAEIVYKEIPSKLVNIKFGIKGEDKSITVASTRPEMLAACKVVIVNPADSRYTGLVGKAAIVPIYENEVKIISDESAKMDYGTGAEMLCTYGDYNDVLLARKLNIKETIIIDERGKMTDKAGDFLAGLSVKDARDKIIEILKGKGYTDKIEEIMHRSPFCDRSNTLIEIIPMDEYYVDVVSFKDKLKDLANHLNFIPDWSRELLMNWIGTALDWPISRRRFYGTEIPIWYCKNCGEPFVPEPGKYYKPWHDDPPSGTKCNKCGSTEFIGDTRTFDTWVDSSISSLYVTRYMSDKKFHSLTYPLSIRPQGPDIVRTWLFYSLLRGYQLTGKAPWRSVWIDGVGLDEHGEKMSKSKGNVVDPSPIMEKYGADAFRFWAASEASTGSNMLFSEKKLQGASKFLNKLLNIAKFIDSFKLEREVKYEDLLPSDKWILSNMSKLSEEVMSAYKSFDFFTASNRVREFIWNIFAPHYIEMVKARAYGNNFSDAESDAAVYTLHQVFRELILLLAPVTPFIADKLWRQMYKDARVDLEEFPHLDKFDKNYYDLTEAIVSFNTMVWKGKKDAGKSLRDSISMKVPDALKPLSRDLISMHNLV